MNFEPFYRRNFSSVTDHYYQNDCLEVTNLFQFLFFCNYNYMIHILQELSIMSIMML